MSEPRPASYPVRQSGIEGWITKTQPYLPDPETPPAVQGQQEDKMRMNKPSRREQAKARQHYWLTPKAWNKSCSHCGTDGAGAVRPIDHRYACEACIDRLGIKARESKAWRDGGSRAGAAVVIRYSTRAARRTSA